MHKWRTIILLFLPVATAIAQTRIEASTQTNGDFSRAKATKPAKAGTTLPATCGAGEVFFKLDTAAGQNLYLCPAGTWIQLTSGGGGGGGNAVTSTSALTDLMVTFNPNTPNQLTIAPNCSIAAPCNVRFGGATYRITAPVTLTVPSGVAVGGMVYIYLSAGPTLNVYSSFTVAITCTSSGIACSVVQVSSTPQFPSDSVPLATWTGSAGQWDPLGGLDLRAFISNRSSILAGTGIVIADNPASITVSADTSVVGVRVAPPATSSSSCVQGYYAADTSFFYQCVALNTWLRVAIATW